MKLLTEALMKFTCGLVAVGLLIFLPAGTLCYSYGWLFICLLFLMIPLVLGSWYALIAFAFYPAVIVVRLKDEEELLTKELPGYAEYKKKVKYRIIPFIW